MKNRLFLGIFAIFALVGSAAFGAFSENSLKGSEPIFSISGQGVEVLNLRIELGSEGITTQKPVRCEVGRRIKTVDAGSGIWLNAYDAGGRLVSARDPLGAASVFAYDLLDRLVSEKNPNGQVTRHEYDRAGRRIATIDALGRRSVTAFDLRDRVTSVTDPEGRLVSFGYDEGGRRVRLSDGANRIWRWNYDALDRVLNETDPLNHIVRYTYDGVGNVTARTNARGQTISYGYDPMNRLVRAEYPDGGVATFAYDLEGREISRFGRAGGVTRTWDSVGHLTSEKFHPWNRGWELFYDRAGNRIKGISPDNETFLYGYDALNRLIMLDPPGSDNTVSHAYDKAGRLVTTRRGDLVSMFGYDRASRLVSLRHESWRTLGKQIRKEPLLVRSYVYDAVGNVVRETDEKGQASRFTYDGSDWLVGCEYPGGQRTSYAYNGAGDRLIERTGNQSVSYRYDEAGRLIGRGNVSLDYDADGNLVRENAGTQGTEYVWTSDNRLSSVAVKTACKRHTWAKCVCPGHRSVEEYAYLPEDWRRIGRTTNGVNYASIYDGDDESHEYLVVPGFLTKMWQFGRFCIRPSLPQLIRQREFIGGPGTDDLQCTRYLCRDLWMLQDRLGSTIGLAHRSGTLVGKIGYDAWGSFRWPGSGAYLQPPCREDGLGAHLDRFGGHILGDSLHDPWNLGYHYAKVLTPYLYTGRRLDSFTGNYNNRNRYYSPKVGRFSSKDPIGFNGGLNLWGYCNNNPVRYTDPFGLSAENIRSASEYLLETCIFSYQQQGKALSSNAEEAFDVYQNLPATSIHPGVTDAKVELERHLRDLARQISRGHATDPDKHVYDAETLGFKGPHQLEDLENHILEIMKTIKGKALDDNRRAFWDQRTKSLLIRDPNNPDGGTFLIPEDGIDYYKRLK